MAEKANLSGKIDKRLPQDAVRLLRSAGKTADEQQQNAYLVGGVVRDLLLERENLDLDIVVEGDAIKLARKAAAEMQAEITEHRRFGTAKIQWGGIEMDMVTARAETYAKPGALPTVKPGTIGDDLARRDFTINAMAAELSPRRFGELLDPHNGRSDLKHKLIRALHEKSFVDDATRIWRAIRYEQRLGFQIEPDTLERLKQGTGWLKTVSGDRIRRELEHVLREEQPEKALCRADELGVMAEIHPSLKGDIWLMETFALAYEYCLPDAPPMQLYLALLTYRLSAAEVEKVIEYLRLPKTTAKVLRDTVAIKARTGELAAPGIPPSHIYKLLHGYSTTALIANLLATDDDAAEEHIELYLDVLRYVRTLLKGEDIRRLGVKAGPKISETLERLLEAKLDGKVSTRGGEEEMVMKLQIKSSS